MNKSLFVFAITAILILGTLTVGNASALPNLPDDLPDVSKAPEKVRVIQGENLIAYAKAHYTTYDNPANYQTGSNYSGVAQLYLPSGSGAIYGCSGALLPTGSHILTAAHCVTDSNGNLDLVINNNSIAVFLTSNGNEIIPIKGVTVYGDYDGDFIKGNDIAVIELMSEASNYVQRYNYATNDDQIGNNIHKVGYGISGYLSSGADSNTYPFGTKRDGQNIYDAFGDTMYNALGLSPFNDYIPQAVYQFDSDDGSKKHDAFDFFFGISGRGLGTNEVNSASGDSGGPSFNSEGEITGITSYGITLQYTNRQTSDCTKQFGVPKLDSSCGEFSGDTRVSIYASFIEDVLGGSTSVPVSTIANNDAYETPFDTVLSVDASNGVLTNDSGNNLSASLNVGPSKGTLDLSIDGSFTYTPYPTSEGTDSFTYTATGDNDSDDGIVTITIQASPPPAGSLLTDITPSQKQKGPHTDVSFTVKVTDGGVAVSDILVNFSITRSDPDREFIFSGTTDSSGSVKFTVMKALSITCYTGTINNWSSFDSSGEQSDTNCTS